MTSLESRDGVAVEGEVEQMARAICRACANEGTPKMDSSALDIMENEGWWRFTEIARDTMARLAALRTPATTGEGEVWIVWFEDRDMPPEVFTGHRARECALRRYEQASTHFNCHLFQRISPAALVALPLSSGWQPIETAPRDGMPILGFTPDPDFSPETGLDVIVWERDENEWYSAGDPVAFQPTHWQPLPPPPSREGV